MTIDVALFPASRPENRTIPFRVTDDPPSHLIEAVLCSLVESPKLWLSKGHHVGGCSCSFSGSFSITVLTPPQSATAVLEFMSLLIALK